MTPAKRRKAAIRYWSWRIRHPFAEYRDFYSEVVNKKIATDKPPLWAAGTPRDPEMLNTLLALGLHRGSSVIDYGCGSLRFGAAMIEFLDKARYRGMDIDERFFRRGIDAMPAQLLAEKAPHFANISDETVATAAKTHPDFIASWQVIPVIPPSAHGDYFRKVRRLIGPQTLFVADFFETPSTVRLSDMAWGNSREALTATVHRAAPDLRVEYSDHRSESGSGPNHVNSWMTARVR